MKTVGVYEAKTSLAKLLGEVEQGETVVITRHGKPVAELRTAGARAEKPIGQLIEEIKIFRKNLRLDGVTVRELIEDGRR